MRNDRRILVLGLLLVLFGCRAAEAAWTKPNKKPVTAWQGFQNSANGAVQAVLPWNWFGKRDEGR